MNLNKWQSIPLLALGAYGVFCLAVIIWQYRLLYYPQRLTEAAAREAFDFCKVARWPDASGAEYRGITHAVGARNPTETLNVQRSTLNAGRNLSVERSALEVERSFDRGALPLLSNNAFFC